MSQATLDKSQTAATSRVPRRLHHHAWVVDDQERTRVFYEDVLGIPLTAFWIEQEPFEGQDIILSHAFYGLQDGSALAFFSLDDPKYQKKFKSPHTEIFNHVALLVDDETQERLIERLTASKLYNFTIEHGYCRSLYVMDPDGLRLEFAVDSNEIERINAEQLVSAHASLKAWMDGRRQSNNTWRP